MFQNSLRTKQLSADQKVLVSNMVSNSYVAYSMAVVPYDTAWLRGLDRYTSTTIKHAMGLSANAKDAPLYTTSAVGGKGLISLVDLQDTIQCDQTMIEMNNNMLSALTAKSTWYLKWRVEGGTNTHWEDALTHHKLTTKPRERNNAVIRNADIPPTIIATLHKKGCANWDKITTNNKLNQFKLNCVFAQMATEEEYQIIANTICLRGSLALKPKYLAITSFKHKRRETRCTNLNPKEEADYYIPYPSKLLFIFTDGSCTDNKCSRGIFYSKGSHRNCSFSAHTQVISMVTELLAIEEALLSCPTRYNLHIIMDSKAGPAKPSQPHFNL